MDELEFVKRELEKHRGKGNAISAGDIENMLGYPRDDTHAKGRKLVKKCAKQFRMPISGDSSGYFIITNETELNEYKANLQSRKKKIDEREKIIENNFKEWNK